MYPKVTAFSPVLDALPESVLVTDQDDRIIYANALARETFALDYSEGDLKVADFFSFQGEGDSSVYEAGVSSFEGIARCGTGKECRVSVRIGSLEDGLKAWLVGDLSEAQDDRQRMIDYMADLTTAQARIREYTRQIEVFRQVVDGMEQGILLSATTGSVLFCNRFSRQIFGFDLTGSSIDRCVNQLSANEEVAGPGAWKGEVLVLNESQGIQTRCYLNRANLDPKGEIQVWTFFELTEEIANTQAFIDFSAELAMMNRNLTKKNEEILLLSRTDVLTGVLNRRAIVDQLAKSIENSVVSSGSLGLAVLDIDRFKEVNDHHGHLAGDDVIRRVANLATGALGKTGVLGRYGGEEFLLVWEGVTPEKIVETAEAVRHAVEAGSKGSPIPVTVTLGVAAFVPGMSLDDLLDAADRAMYSGKRAGRNRVVVA